MVALHATPRSTARPRPVLAARRRGRGLDAPAAGDELVATLPCTGRTRKLELPHFVKLSTILKQVDDTTQMLRSVVDDHVVDALIQATRSVLPESLTPKTGIGFVLDVERVFGMDL